MKKRKNGYRRIIELLPKSGGICYLCKEPLPIKEIEEYLDRRINHTKYKHIKNGKLGRERNKLGIDIDHIVPFSETGNNQLENLAIVHIKCNIKKGDYHSTFTPNPPISNVEKRS